MAGKSWLELAESGKLEEIFNDPKNKEFLDKLDEIKVEDLVAAAKGDKEAEKRLPTPPQ